MKLNNHYIKALSHLEIAKYTLLNQDSVMYEPEIEAIEKIQKTLVHFQTLDNFPKENL